MGLAPRTLFKQHSKKHQKTASEFHQTKHIDDIQCYIMFNDITKSMS